MKYEIYFGFNVQTYYLQNTKLTDILGNFGGTINLLAAIGHIFCSFYNQWLTKHKLINMAFENQIVLDEKKKKYINYIKV